jgi:putative endonuclease
MTRPGREERRAAYGLGLDAETRVAWVLRLKLWSILARRWRCPLGEIDLIAARGRTLIFVEVKARATLEAAVEAVTPRARARILASADLWVARNPHYADHDRRFDIVAVLPRRWPQHLADAFRADDIDLPRWRSR